MLPRKCLQGILKAKTTGYIGCGIRDFFCSWCDSAHFPSICTVHDFLYEFLLEFNRIVRILNVKHLFTGHKGTAKTTIRISTVGTVLCVYIYI
jgi:hypothetical protein